MSHAVRWVGATMLVVSMFGGYVGAVAAASPFDVRLGVSSITSGAFCPDSQEREFVRLINQFRHQHGKPSVKFSGTLGAAAEHHSIEMATFNYFSHTLRGGVSAFQNMEQHGYPSNTHKAENIAAGKKTARGAFNMWKNSPPHRATMLNNEFRAIGIGRAYGPSSRYGWYWTTTFGSKFDGGHNC